VLPARRASTPATQAGVRSQFHYWVQLPGESLEFGSARVRYIADKVIPEVTQRLRDLN
jgi:hypothetical protein